MTYTIEAIGHVVSAPRTRPEDDFWGGTVSRIVLTEAFDADALVGLDEFSHVEVLYLLHQTDPAKAQRGLRHPRNNPAWPRVGIFAQRAKNRPNRLGSTTCRIVRVEGKSLDVLELDAIEGTPVIDLKPVLREYLPRTEIRQPAWTHELMRDYWTVK